MAKLTTVTRQLAERRARLAGEAQRLDRLVAEVSERLAKVRAELAAVDLILPTFDARVDPETIAPIAAQKGRYGKWGAFKEALLGMLKEASTVSVSTSELSLRLRHRFELELETPEQVARWNKAVLRPQLRRLDKQGIVERVRVSDVHSDDVFWRMAPAPAEGSLEELRVQADRAKGAATA